MRDVNQLFRAATEHAQPAPGALARQLQAQRRQARYRKLSALAVAAVIVAALALFAANALHRGQDGSLPGQPVPIGSGFVFTVFGTDGAIRSSIPIPFGTLHSDVSPDGTSVAFTIENGPDSQIATMRLDGAQLRILTSDSLDADRARWSPDGSQLLFSVGTDSTGRRLMVMDADGGNVREIAGTRNPEGVPSDWSPDGSLILYTTIDNNGRGRRDLATIPATGGASHQVTVTRDMDEGPGTWSPDGSMIAYTRGDGVRNEIWVMDADGSGQHLLVTLPGKDAAAPEWSPDGSTIAFIGTTRGSEQLAGSDSVYVVDVATGDITRIVRGIASYQTYDSRATWLPDGDAVLVMTVAP
jgi:dipeptidyl aminopeptidase/acylaminoacyl peptidase